MSHRSEKRVSQAVRLALMTAVSLDASLLSHLAIAADAAPTSQTAANSGDLTEIIVTGYRESLQSALDAKRKSIQPIESVTAEDIGKMPDQDVAESLERLPGVSINRSGGKGTQVLIDGLGNNLITLNGEVLLTGREVYVSGEASGGGGSGGLQYASLEGIPSEEIGGIDVIKNPTAQNREGGLGGIIDIKTRSPLAQDMGLNLAGNVRGTSAQNSNSTTPVGTLVGGFKFSDDLAITGSVSYDETKTHDKQFQDQNRNQWLVTNTATVGTYVGSPIASTNSVLPGGQTYIDPQLAYFSDVTRSNRDQGRDHRRRMEVERQHHEQLQLVLHRRGGSHHELFEQGLVLGRQRRDEPPSRLRRASLVPRHRSVAAVLDRRQWRRAKRHVHGQRRGNRDAL